MVFGMPLEPPEPLKPCKNLQQTIKQKAYNFQDFFMISVCLLLFVGGASTVWNPREPHGWGPMGTGNPKGNPGEPWGPGTLGA